jgi:5'-methylthioadenosine phosphorylase
VLNQNAKTAQEIVRRVLGRLATPPARACACGSALATALMTDPEAIPEATLAKLAPLVGKYYSR